jgi:predicted  nucleic acid-binding Zn-ribbon protein
VTADWFLKLKEFDSLEKMRISHLKAIQGQEERLQLLNVKRQDQQKVQEILKTELHSLQQAYFETEKKLKICEEQASRLKDLGGDSDKIDRYQKDAATLEDDLFAILEKIESHQVSMQENKTFLSGIENTIQEIKSEVEAEIKEHSKAIEQLELRLKLIKDELPPDFKEALERTLKKNLALGPFTRVDQGSCYFCRYKISRIDESEIDMQRALKFCPQCSRLFLPYGS